MSFAKLTPSAAARLPRLLALLSFVMFGLWLPLCANGAPPAPASDGVSTNAVRRLPTLVVTGEAEYEGVVQPAIPPPVQGVEIYSGKKASVIDLDALPKVQANNYRQAFALTPGLLYSEETTPLVSIGYRGIGEPHRMQYFQVLKDGIPIHADMIGYPEAYYTPPLDVVDRMEFVRGGASLMYGPHHAGALNYVTYEPRRDRSFSARSQHVLGSDELYSTYNSVDGTIGRLGYLAYFNHRHGDGFRAANSDYRLDGGHFKLKYDLTNGAHLLLAFDAYEEEHGEPGGLSRTLYTADRDQTTRLLDRFHLRRYVPSLTYHRDFSDHTVLSVKSWGGYYDRFSRRQAGGGFGAPPTGTSNNIERQEFFSFGIEARLRHDYPALGGEHTFAGGVTYYRADSPRTDRRGATADAATGPIASASQRDIHYGAVFFENRFNYSRLSITPGFRLENIHQSVGTSTHDPATGTQTGQGTKDKLEVVPLGAITLAYRTTARTELYASAAQSYRATIFTESVIPASGAVVAGDVEPTTGLTYELGYRGAAGQWLVWDTSLFLVDLDNKFGGTVTSGGVTTLRSVGRSINYGWESALELDVVGLLDTLRDTQWRDRFGSFSLHGNVSLLAAEIHGGASDGFEPQYAPDYLVRAGAMYRWRDRVKVALMGTIVDDHYATDDENPTRFIPSYVVWDLTAEVKVLPGGVSVMAGVNNLFDEDYYARIRSDGIDPAYGRNYYAGFSIAF